MLAGAPSGSNKRRKADRGIEIKSDPTRLPARLPARLPSLRFLPSPPSLRPMLLFVAGGCLLAARDATSLGPPPAREERGYANRAARARVRARTSERGWNASFGSWQHLGICSKLEIAVQQRGITTIDLTGSAVKNLESVTCTNSAYLYYSLNRRTLWQDAGHVMIPAGDSTSTSSQYKHK